MFIHAEDIQYADIYIYIYEQNTIPDTFMHTVDIVYHIYAFTNTLFTC